MKKIAKFLIVEKNKDLYTVRMTPELQDDLGTVGFAQLQKKDRLEKNDVIVKIEASKAIVDIKMPISGDVVEINEEILTNPQVLNSASDQDNWIVKLNNVDEKEFDQLEDY